MASRYAEWRNRAVPVAAGLAASALGGVVFLALGLPAPWISGGSVGSAVAALSGVRMSVPAKLRDATFLGLGMSMGAGVTPETLQQVPHWPLSLVVLAVTIAAIVFTTQLYLVRVAGLDRATAFFSAVPGALSNVMALALDTRADIGRIALQQSVRLLLLIVALPILISASGVAMAAAPQIIAGPRDLAIIATVGIACGLACHALRVPGGLLNGAFLSSSVLHATGTVQGNLPLPVQTACFIVLATSVGCRLYGLRGPDLRNGLGHALVCFLLSSLIALAGVVVVVEFTGAIGFGPALLAFAPGGVEAMTALSFSLALDPAYVATHHFVRFVGVAMALPVMMALALNRPVDPA